jgi:hypothetical protein
VVYNMLSCRTPSIVAGVTSMFGTAAAPMTFPAASQNAPLGSDYGPPVVPALASDDSYLTIGATTQASQLSSVGIVYSAWVTSGLSTTNGAVLVLDPANAPSGTVTLAKLLTPPNVTGSQTATFNLQGTTAGGGDSWRVYGLTVSWSPPAVNCAGSWGNWGACSATCGSGTRTRTYTVTTPLSNGGAPCPASDGASQPQPCPNLPACWTAGSCYDGILNQNETGVDCGGICLPCTYPPVYGCMDSTAINYNSAANFNASCIYPFTDCAGVQNGPATTDQCGTCDANPTNDCVQDCNGTWGGTAVLDHCQVCGGDNSTCASFPYTVITPTLRAVLVGIGTGNIDHLAYQTYRIYVDLPQPSMTVYALYGDDQHTVFVPRAIQHDAHDPSNVGGPTAAALHNNGFQQSYAGAEDLNIADSWLTLGLDNGDPQNYLSTTTAMSVELSGGWVNTSDPNQACVCPTGTAATATTCIGTVTNSLGAPVSGQSCHYEEKWGEDHVLVDAGYGFNGGMLFSAPAVYSAMDTGSGVLLMQLAVEAGPQHVRFNLQGDFASVPMTHSNVTLRGQSCAYGTTGGRNPALMDACTWKAFQVQLNFTSTPPAPCPYDAMPKPNAAGVCTSAYGCPDGLINVQDLQEMLAKMATCRLDCSMACSPGPSTCTANSCNENMAAGHTLTSGCGWVDTFVGYPLDAHPIPGCRSGGSGQVCQAGYGNGLLNVHDLLGLLSRYSMNYNINPC